MYGCARIYASICPKHFAHVPGKIIQLSLKYAINCGLKKPLFTMKFKDQVKRYLYIGRAGGSVVDGCQSRGRRLPVISLILSYAPEYCRSQDHLKMVSFYTNYKSLLVISEHLGNVSSPDVHLGCGISKILHPIFRFSGFGLKSTLEISKTTGSILLFEDAA